MLSMKNNFHKSFPCMLITLFVLAYLLDIFGNTTVYAKVASPDTAHTNNIRKLPIDSQAVNNINNITLNMRSVKLVKGKTVRLKVLNISGDYTVNFQSSNTRIATVSSTGKIKGKKNGEATITVTVKQNNRTVRKLTCDVLVGPAAVSIVIPKSQITLTLGQTGYINYIVKPSNSVEVPVFKSSNKKVATVSRTGVITTHSAGRATITATIENGKYDQVTVIVNKKTTSKLPKK